MLSGLSRWRAMPIGVSCLLHVGLAAGLVLGQQWVVSVVAVQPPVLPVQLVTLDAVEPRRESPPPPAPPRRERTNQARRPAPPRPPERPAAKVEEPAPQPLAATPVPAEIAPAPMPAAPPAVSEPAIASAPPSTPPAVSAPFAPAPPAAIPTTKASNALADGITRTARPQGGYQIRPAYPSAPRRLGIQGTTLLRVHVLADGKIGDVLVDRSAGHPDLDRAAAEAVRRWRFEPARRGADPVAMWVLLPVEFRLTQ